MGTGRERAGGSGEKWGVIYSALIIASVGGVGTIVTEYLSSGLTGDRGVSPIVGDSSVSKVRWANSCPVSRGVGWGFSGVNELPTGANGRRNFHGLGG